MSIMREISESVHIPGEATAAPAPRDLPPPPPLDMKYPQQRTESSYVFGARPMPVSVVERLTHMKQRFGAVRSVVHDVQPVGQEASSSQEADTPRVTEPAIVTDVPASNPADVATVPERSDVDTTLASLATPIAAGAAKPNGETSMTIRTEGYIELLKKHVVDDCVHFQLRSASGAPIDGVLKKGIELKSETIGDRAFALVEWDASTKELDAVDSDDELNKLDLKGAEPAFFKTAKEANDLPAIVAKASRKRREDVVAAEVTAAAAAAVSPKVSNLAGSGQDLKGKLLQIWAEHRLASCVAIGAVIFLMLSSLI